ncbi:MAG TPA: YCF48-related protein [Bryobacteraceae bacterium]|nr:YCF48-related protein [Bryobacteraceae bacterium]
MKTIFLFCVAILPAAAQKWSTQYFYDELRKELEITDLAFPTAQTGIAVGAIYDLASGGERHISILTSDGGAHWTQAPLREYPRSVFFLNEKLGWMVTDKALWGTVDSGRTWKKLCDQLKPDKKLEPPTMIGLLLRVWFLDESHGFGVGLQKTIVETKDGGRSWSPVEAAKKPEGNPAFTAYTHIVFANSKNGVIFGGSQPPRRDEGMRGSLPAWMDPESAAKRKAIPSLTLMAETTDGGATWSVVSVPLQGIVTSARITAKEGLIVMGFDESFQWPSDVYRLADRKTGRVFRDKSPRVIDALLFNGPRAFLAGVEPTGKMNTAPIPGKVRILESSDFQTWTEMKVDYKATGRQVILAGPDPEHLWVATDTGRILHLVGGNKP